VLVGGLVVDLRSDGFDLDDGTAIGRVVLTGLATDAIDLVEPGDAINVTGLVTTQSDGVAAVVVEDPSAIVLGSTLGGAPPDPAASDAGSGTPGLRTAGFGSDGMAIPGAGAGLVGLLTVGLLSAGMTVLRRRHARRLLAIRMASRLAAVGGSHRADEAPITGPQKA